MLSYLVERHLPLFGLPHRSVVRGPRGLPGGGRKLHDLFVRLRLGLLARLVELRFGRRDVRRETEFVKRFRPADLALGLGDFCGRLFRQADVFARELLGGGVESGTRLGDSVEQLFPIGRATVASRAVSSRPWAAT